MAVTAVVACASAVASPASTAAAKAEGAGAGTGLVGQQGSRNGTRHAQTGEPWLASGTVESLPESPMVFDVSANNGVPWIRDPRSSPSWQNLRRVPGSQGGYVTNISIAEDAATSYAPDPTTTSAVRVTARSAAGVFYTVCRLGNLSMLSIPLPTSGPLPCTPWAAVPN